MSNGGEQPAKELSSSANAIAGAVASTISTILTYPFDLIRTRFQGMFHSLLSNRAPLLFFYEH